MPISAALILTWHLTGTEAAPFFERWPGFTYALALPEFQVLIRRDQWNFLYLLVPAAATVFPIASRLGIVSNLFLS